MLYLFCLGLNTTDLGALRPVLDSCSLVGWCVGTLGSLGIVFDHQAPLTRPLEAVMVACPTSRLGGAKWSGCFLGFPKFH